MGYSTDFKGEFKFSQELSASQLAKVKSYFGEDCRNHPDWGVPDLYHVDLELLDDFSGIKWNGMEKTYDMPELINLIINGMRKSMPDFALVGKFICQGEDLDDRYEIVIRDGKAVQINTPHPGVKIECPHCEESFYLDEIEDGKPVQTKKQAG